MPRFHRVTVFCGSREGVAPIFMEQARSLGSELVARGIDLVYGGGSVGLMGAVARSVRDGGGKVTGIIPNALMERELSGEAIGELILTDGMHERKHRMSELAEAFIALPGGFGTFEELMEVITWVQLGIQSKPVGILNIAHFYDPLIALIEQATKSGFIQTKDREIFVVADNAEALLDKMEKMVPVKGLTTWLTPSQT